MSNWEPTNKFKHTKKNRRTIYMHDYCYMMTFIKAAFNNGCLYKFIIILYITLIYMNNQPIIYNDPKSEQSPNIDGNK